MSTATLERRAPVAATATPPDLGTALRFLTCGSVDDGKSTLIGRLLVDSRAVLQDQLASVQRSGQADLALLTDGLQAEREQGITIDVAYRYFNTATRKFVIADAPGHEQYTRNMVTAASSADAAVVLVDATKLRWQDAIPALLPQTRRHALLARLLRVPSIVFAVNKLDAVDQPALAFSHIQAALLGFAAEADIAGSAVVPVSALIGTNVVEAAHGWCGYTGPSLLQILEQLPVTSPDVDAPVSLPVQWVEKFSSSSETSTGRRIFWGRVATGVLCAGQRIIVMPGGKTATVAEVLNATRQSGPVAAGRNAGLILDSEIDISRGDWLLAEVPGSSTAGETRVRATVAWLDDEALVPGRTYWALHGHQWVKAKVTRVINQIDIATLDTHHVEQLPANAIGSVELSLLQALPVLPFSQSRVRGSLVLVDMASHRTAGAVLVA